MALRNMRSRKPWIIVDGDSLCWIWALAKDENGYGFIGGNRWKGEHRYAHRLFYALHKGPIPKGMVIDHLCTRPACVNPDHLEAVTQAENVHRGRLPKITPEIAQEIRKATGSQRAIGERYGVSQPLVSMIKNGERW